VPTHLKGATANDLGAVTLLSGDPSRVKMIGYSLTNPKLVTESREFTLISGYRNGRKVSICSTGIGIGSTEIAVIELIELGAKYLVRLGGCGAWSDKITPGDLIINHAMARESGTLESYVHDSFPAVADPVLVNWLKKTATAKDFSVHVGMGLTTQSYYLGQDRKPSIKHGPEISDFMRYWKERNIINCDMETAIIYILASIYGVHAANCLVVHGNRHSNQWIEDENYHDVHTKASNVILEACFHALNEYS